ncbi:MAG: hypothetical protein M1818_006594 [Claussenomyces sp. TS43310]|nr:MAG: hypothetical protein M1818_006594 [Claussenomyces sp. TS43310]
MAARWGSFLQQAVAGVESRLDNILGEPETHPQPAIAGINSPAPVTSAAVQLENGNYTLYKAPPAKSTSNGVVNARLQERLARAIAAKNHAPSTPNVPPRADNLATSGHTGRSLDVLSVSKGDVTVDQTSTEEDDTQGVTSGGDVGNAIPETQILLQLDRPEDGVRVLTEPTTSEFHEQSASSLQQASKLCEPKDASLEVNNVSSGASGGLNNSATSNDTILPSRQGSNGIDRVDQERQEEIHGYIERIDALQAKLQYLSRESADSARKAATAASSGTLERKLAEKDEQIALLLNEGQKLSKTELKHITLIKKLRFKASEVEKQSMEAQKHLEWLEKDRAASQQRLRHTDAIERQLNERQKLMAQLQKDMQVTKAERDAKDSIITDLNAQLANAVSQAKANDVKAAQDLVEHEKQRTVELETDISALTVEKELAAGRFKVQLDELRAKGEREAERARVTELEMKAEQQMMESRLEALRTRAEEVSSGATGDAQAKMLRQIETLQLQYAVASENWQRIEASLTSRATTLERERNEALQREAEIRRKAREVVCIRAILLSVQFLTFQKAQKAKQNEEALEEAQSESSSLQHKLGEQSRRLDSLQQRAKEAEVALIQAKETFAHDKKVRASEFLRRVEQEKTRWREELMRNGSFTQAGVDSPVPSTADYPGLQNLQATRTPTRSETHEGSRMEKLLGPRSSAQPVGPGSGPDMPTRPIRHDSATLSSEDVQDTPSLLTMDNDDYFDHVKTPSSQDKMNDALSISTVGAGPSVQLVERMSAAVRRLETEKVSTKEELVRLAGQRDEARAGIVTLMQEVEARRSLDGRLKELEDENRKINARYQTTLEMLGEKSELVEELKADVQDVKAMYRDLVERTVK